MPKQQVIVMNNTASAENKIKKISGKKVFTVVSAVILTGLFVAFGITTLNSRADIGVLENKRAEIAEQYEQQVKVNEELQAVLDSDDKDDYIEMKAREKGYVKSDEIVFYDISASE